MKIVLSSQRGPESLADEVAELGHRASAATVEAAASLDHVLLAVPWPNVEDALRGLPAWNGRVLIDATNPFSEYSPNLKLADLGGKGASEMQQAGGTLAGHDLVDFGYPLKKVRESPMRPSRYGFKARHAPPANVLFMDLRHKKARLQAAILCTVKSDRSLSLPGLMATVVVRWHGAIAVFRESSCIKVLMAKN